MNMPQTFKEICSQIQQLLQNTNLEKTKITCTIRHGTYETFVSDLNKRLKENAFSLQVDESNKMHGKRIFIMLVKFYDTELGKVVNRFWRV